MNSKNFKIIAGVVLAAFYVACFVFASLCIEMKMFVAISILVLIISVSAFVLKFTHFDKTHQVLANVAIALCAGFCLAMGIIGCDGDDVALGVLATVFSGVAIFIAILCIILEFSKRNKPKTAKQNKENYNNIYENLKKLKSLYEANILTKEEYEEKRKKYTDML